MIGSVIKLREEDGKAGKSEKSESPNNGEKIQDHESIERPACSAIALKDIPEETPLTHRWICCGLECPMAPKCVIAMSFSLRCTQLVHENKVIWQLRSHGNVGICINVRLFKKQSKVAYS